VPPTRTWIVVPLLGISRMLNPAGNAKLSACTADAMNTDRKINPVRNRGVFFMRED
jgi:hypothetical protein